MQILFPFSQILSFAHSFDILRLIQNQHLWAAADKGHCFLELSFSFVDSLN